MCADKRKPESKPKSNTLLQELDQLQAREKLPDIEPPALIDQAVRNMARRAVHHQEHGQTRPEVPGDNTPDSGRLRWIAGLATASMAVIALGIALVQAPQSPEPIDPDFELKKDMSRLKTEQTHEELQSAAALRAGAADQAADRSTDEAANRAYRSTGLKRIKQAATAMAASETSVSESSAIAGQPPAMAKPDEKGFTDSVDIEKQADKESAQSWLDLIQQLQDQGLVTEAAEQLRAFQQDYPDYPLPDWALRLQQMEQ